MEAVSLTKCQWGRELCDTIGFSYRRDFRSIRDLRSPSSRLENKGSKSSTFDIGAHKPYKVLVIQQIEPQKSPP